MIAFKYIIYTYHIKIISLEVTILLIYKYLAIFSNSKTLNQKLHYKMKASLSYQKKFFSCSKYHMHSKKIP